ncbi:uncharacterized protein BP5553_08882 [Venustampulla echinocandica]|uniref:Tuberous sclerosis 1 protein n=1 Tax=Venustampulla echinocandica TaxID=2656787 RepID=A0A370TDA2_9HELO|nr:uncharacterized protein BP5553_08882 [Venustampulla echinocandica]RDL32426.1 hypothetical protein BP5553_08882 [Venustampulla echinocandica]
MPGSLKGLTKAINTSLSSSAPALPLPDDVVEIINAYLEKPAGHDEAESQRLQEDLLNIYQTCVVDSPHRLAPFVAIVRMLKPAIRGGGRLLQWWDKLSVPVLSRLGEEKGLAVEAREALLGTLIYDEDESDNEDAKMTSKVMGERLLFIWLAKSRAASEAVDSDARFVEGQIRLILVAYGKKRPKYLLTLINKFFVDKENRILALSLLCEFVRHGPPHLHQILETPLFDNLLRCLQIDTSTRVISLSLTALIMCLPHIPTAVAKYLPALFNIYSRMLFWDRERRRPDAPLGSDDDELSENAPTLASQASEKEKPWDKLSYLLESDDETVPELLHYFTFLYGLYPINFMSYIRKPQKYLRHAKFSGADELDVEPTEIRQRSDPFRQAHLLHPNFFTTTLETELTDNNRWMNSEAADVVAACMALYSPVEGGSTLGRGALRNIEPNSDVPEQPLLDEDPSTSYPSGANSWRNTQSTAVGLSDEFRTSSLPRKLSHQSMPSVTDSPSIQASDRVDSPTIPVQQMPPSPSQSQIQDMLRSQKPTRGSLYQTLTNDSVTSLTPSQNINSSSGHVDAYLSSLSREILPRSSSPHTSDGKIAYLQREIQLLSNDLNFERYLKQQHLSHIGQLRRGQVHQSRLEAETQNLINSNRGLKSKLEEAKRLNLQMKKETEKSKTHARKWESDLSAKLRVLREEQKKWNVQRDELNIDLAEAKQNIELLKKIVISSEANELAAKQKVQSVESSREELTQLRGEVDKLTLLISTYEAGETEAVRAKENEEAALKRVEILEMELRARDKALANAKEAFEAETRALQAKDNDSEDNKRKRISQDMIDGALAASRRRIVELSKSHNRLLNRFNALESAYLQLKEIQDHDRHARGHEPLGSFIDGPNFVAGSPSPSSMKGYSAGRAFNTETDTSESSSSAFPVRSARLDSSYNSSNPSTPIGRSPTLSSTNFSTQQFQSPRPFSPSGPAGMRERKPSLDGDAQSGIQNASKKDKDKKDKDKSKDTAKDGSDAKKEKKSGGIRGIRAFV